jgi:hypothetical protein
MAGSTCSGRTSATTNAFAPSGGSRREIDGGGPGDRRRRNDGADAAPERSDPRCAQSVPKRFGAGRVERFQGSPAALHASGRRCHRSSRSARPTWPSSGRSRTSRFRPRSRSWRTSAAATTACGAPTPPLSARGSGRRGASCAGRCARPSAPGAGAACRGVGEGKRVIYLGNREWQPLADTPNH